MNVYLRTLVRSHLMKKENSSVPLVLAGQSRDKEGLNFRNVSSKNENDWNLVAMSFLMISHHLPAIGALEHNVPAIEIDFVFLRHKVCQTQNNCQ